MAPDRSHRLWPRKPSVIWPPISLAMRALPKEICKDARLIPLLRHAGQRLEAAVVEADLFERGLGEDLAVRATALVVELVPGQMLDPHLLPPFGERFSGNSMVRARRDCKDRTHCPLDGRLSRQCRTLKIHRRCWCHCRKNGTWRLSKSCRECRPPHSALPRSARSTNYPPKSPHRRSVLWSLC